MTPEQAIKEIENGNFYRVDGVKSEAVRALSHDPVNHPAHYETGKYQCIDVMIEVFGREAVKNFCICNAFKYLWPSDRKNGREDIEKAVWYLRKYLELTEETVSVEGDNEVIEVREA